MGDVDWWVASLAILDRLSHLETLIRGQRVATELFGGLKVVEGYAGSSVRRRKM
jgi:hypothetical protein